jgi:hypothetical protein
MASFTIGYVTHQIKQPLDSITHYLDRALLILGPQTAKGGPEKDAAAPREESEPLEETIGDLRKCRQNCELMQTIVEVRVPGLAGSRLCVFHRTLALVETGRIVGAHTECVMKACEMIDVQITCKEAVF